MSPFHYGVLLIRRLMESFPLSAGSGFKTANQFPRVAAQLAQMIADNGVGAFKSKPAQFFSHPNGGELGIAFQQLNAIVPERIQETLPSLGLAGRRTRPVLCLRGARHRRRL